MSKEAKKNYVEELKKNFTANDSVMIAQYQGLNVNELDTLRAKYEEAGDEERLSITNDINNYLEEIEKKNFK